MTEIDGSEHIEPCPKCGSDECLAYNQDQSTDPERVWIYCGCGHDGLMAASWEKDDDRFFDLFDAARALWNLEALDWKAEKFKLKEAM